jgi:hypothetical protein
MTKPYHACAIGHRQTRRLKWRDHLTLEFQPPKTVRKIMMSNLSSDWIEKHPIGGTHLWVCLWGWGLCLSVSCYAPPQAPCHNATPHHGDSCSRDMGWHHEPNHSPLKLFPHSLYFLVFLSYRVSVFARAAWNAGLLPMPITELGLWLGTAVMTLAFLV